MYAIVEFAGSQVKIEKDQIIEVPKINGSVGDEITSDKVLFMKSDTDSKIGTPYIDSGAVKATIYAQDRTKKTVASIYKRRKQYKKSWGFRREFTLLKITSINS